MVMSKNIQAIDLFCGVGGLSHGLRKSGIDVRVGVDIDEDCRYAYEKNNKATFINKSVDKISASELTVHTQGGGALILAGCAPCQTFSTYNQKADESDRRWWLLSEFQRLIGEINPDMVTMENVPGLAKHEVFLKFTKYLKRKKYHVAYQVVDCSQYGLPQTRSRLVLLASKYGPISILSPESFSKHCAKTVMQAIGHLPPIGAGEVCPKDPLHQSADLSKVNLKRIRASRPGGTWRDWPVSLRAECHRYESGKTYVSVYGRMEQDKPSPTITTQFYGFGNGRFGHPVQDRAISLREGAILQGFPKNYKFFKSGETVRRRVLGRLIGNAVPVTLGSLIGKSFVDHLANI